MKPEALRLAEIADYRDYPTDCLIAIEAAHGIIDSEIQGDKT